jgi:hypothetical protein
MSTPEAKIGYVGHQPTVALTNFPPDQPVAQADAPVDLRIEPPTGALGAEPSRPGGPVEVAPRIFLGDWEDGRSWGGETLNVRDGHSYPNQTFHVEMLIPPPPGWPQPYCVSRAKLDEAADIIEQRQRLGDKVLLVHCLVGMEGSPLAIAWWLVKTSKQPNLQAALAYLKTLRPIVEDRSSWIEPEPVKPVDMRIEIPMGTDRFEPPAPSAAESAVTSPSPGEGVGPATVGAEALTEQQKYERMWSFDQYRNVAPGESIAPTFLGVVKPKPGSVVIDFGAGTGRGALMLALLGNVRVQMLDFASNCLDPDVALAVTKQAEIAAAEDPPRAAPLTFQQHDLTKPCPITAQYGYCTDVLEHIPPDDVDNVLGNILHAAQHVFLQISCTDDSCGALIGHPLHLSVHPYDWWLKKLQSFDAQVHWGEDHGTHALFYVTAWRSGVDFTERGALNVEESVIRSNIETNIKVEGRKQVMPHGPNDIEVLILGGGPSLSEHLEEIRSRRANGARLVTLNGTYNWAHANGLKVSAQIICDARSFNTRFVDPIDDDPNGCRYFLASQVDPELFAKCPPDRTYMWHTGAEAYRELLDQNLKWWYAILGGCTVLLRSLPLLRMLGFQKFHLFGCDGAIASSGPGQYHHHAYPQPENDGEMVIPVTVGGRVFHCNPWMITQAQNFIDLIKFMGDDFELEMHGDGLLSYIITHAAELDRLDDPLGI